MKKIIALSIFLNFVLFGCIYNSRVDEFSDSSFASIPNFSKLNDNIYKGGRPTSEGIRQLKEKGIKTILSLREEDNLDYAEKHIARQYGLKFINLSIPPQKSPPDNKVRNFLEIVSLEDNYPLYFHCDVGIEQSAVMAAVYRVIVEKWDTERAYREAQQSGLKSSFMNPRLKKFIYGLENNPRYF